MSGRGGGARAGGAPAAGRAGRRGGEREREVVKHHRPVVRRRSLNGGAEQARAVVADAPQVHGNDLAAAGTDFCIRNGHGCVATCLSWMLTRVTGPGKELK